VSAGCGKSKAGPKKSLRIAAAFSECYMGVAERGEYNFTLKTVYKLAKGQGQHPRSSSTQDEPRETFHHRLGGNVQVLQNMVSEGEVDLCCSEVFPQVRESFHLQQA
jgi:hypothetical protein